jgi:hypothetical protein
MSEGAEARFSMTAVQPPSGSTVSDSVFRVSHTLSHKAIGVVVRMAASGRWCFICPRQDCTQDACNEFSDPQSAAVALGAHDLDHALARIRDEIQSGKITVGMRAKAAAGGVA